MTITSSIPPVALVTPLPAQVSQMKHLPPPPFVAALEAALVALRHPVQLVSGNNGHAVHRLLDYVTQQEVLRCQIPYPGQLELILPDTAPWVYLVFLKDPGALAWLVERTANRHNTTRPMVTLDTVHDLAAGQWRVMLGFQRRKVTATGDTLVAAWRAVKEQAGITSLASVAPAGWRYQHRDIRPATSLPILLSGKHEGNYEHHNVL